jgi:hypothetical protein
VILFSSIEKMVKKLLGMLLNHSLLVHFWMMASFHGCSVGFFSFLLFFFLVKEYKIH